MTETQLFFTLGIGNTHICRHLLVSAPDCEVSGSNLTGSEIKLMDTRRLVIIIRPLFRYDSWGLGRAAVCDCGTPWTFSYLIFLNNGKRNIK